MVKFQLLNKAKQLPRSACLLADVCGVDIDNGCWCVEIDIGCGGGGGCPFDTCSVDLCPDFGCSGGYDSAPK